MITERQQNILQSIIEEHIGNGEPVSSKLLVNKHGSLAMSSATIRNEMSVLENEGFIFQPHTSAGRIPTEKAFQYYIDNFLRDAALSEDHENMLREVVARAKQEGFSHEKSLAKALALLSGEAVIMAFDKNDIYYTGISNLFSKPEFESCAPEWGEMIDKFDDRIHSLYEKVGSITILIGRNNPFNVGCGLIATRCGEGNEGLLTIVGPMRMDYSYNKALVEEAKHYL